MSLRNAVDVVALIACAVYCTIPLFWLVVHPFIARWRRYGRRSYAWILPIWGAVIATAFLIVWPYRHVHLYDSWFGWVPAALLFALGFSIYSAGFKSFERNQVSGLAELEPDRHRQRLVTTGIRAYVRHPIYLGHLCEVFAWCFATGMVALYLLAAFAIATGAVMIRIEDSVLEVRFGKPYREYKSSVPAVVPRLSRRACASSLQ